MDPTSDAKQPGTTWPFVVVVAAINLAILAGWALVQPPCWNMLKDLPGVLSSLSAFAAMLFGISIVRRGVFAKGGTRYYPRAFGEKKLDPILKKHDTREDYTQVVQRVLSGAKRGDFNSPYFQAVYVLQKTSSDFARAWNDYNYYSAKPRKNGKDQRYVARLERYIFCEVFPLIPSSEK